MRHAHSARTIARARRVCWLVEISLFFIWGTLGAPRYRGNVNHIHTYMYFCTPTQGKTKKNINSIVHKRVRINTNIYIHCTSTTISRQYHSSGSCAVSLRVSSHRANAVTTAATAATAPATSCIIWHLCICERKLQNNVGKEKHVQIFSVCLFLFCLSSGKLNWAQSYACSVAAFTWATLSHQYKMNAFACVHCTYTIYLPKCELQGLRSRWLY